MGEPKFVLIDGVQCELALVKDAARRCVEVAQAIQRFEIQHRGQIDEATSLFLSETTTILRGENA